MRNNKTYSSISSLSPNKKNRSGWLPAHFQWLRGIVLQLQPRTAAALIVWRQSPLLLCVVWVLLFWCVFLSPLLLPGCLYVSLCRRSPFRNVTMKFNMISSCAEVHLVKRSYHGYTDMFRAIKRPHGFPHPPPKLPSLPP
jgi:hypothetical protein